MARQGAAVTAYMGPIDNIVYPVQVLAASQSLEQLISTAMGVATTLAEDVEQVEIVNQSGASVYYQCDGTDALVTEMEIPNNSTYTAVGNRVTLVDVRLIAVAPLNIQLVERVAR